MPSEAKSPRLTLRFATKPKLELRVTEFHIPGPPDGPANLKCSQGKAGDGFFEWREGTQALCICLLRFLSFSSAQLSKGIKFVFDGGVDSPAKTADGVIAKANKSNSWPLSVFGQHLDGRCRLVKYIKRRNADRRDPKRNYELEVQHEQLPQAAIVIEVDGQPVTQIDALARLADEIEDLWFVGQPGYDKQWAKVKEARKLKVVAPKKVRTKTAPKSQEQPAEPRKLEPGIADEKFKTPQSSQAFKPLAELFKTLSVPSIKSHITAALLPARGRKAIEKSLAELLSPECVNVVAEKLASESIDDFCDFYYSDYDSPPDIKSSIATIIATNPELRRKLAAKVAACGYRDMSGWFHSFSFFGTREIVLDVEHALITAAESPDFAEKFEIYAPERLPSLIEHFSRYGCVSAVRIFQKMCEQASERDRKLASLIE